MQRFLELEDGSELYCSKILCIGRNYVAHAKELNNPVPKEPFYFIKPNSALVNEGKRILLPNFSENIHHEIELAVVIGKSGKSIPEEKADEYILGYGVALDLTARDVQGKLKEVAYPWEISKAFDDSCPISKIRFKENVSSVSNVSIELKVNNERRQFGSTSHMIFSVKEIISNLSKYFTLEKGDVILTGTPEGVGQVHSGDILTGEIEGVGRMDFEIS